MINFDIGIVYKKSHYSIHIDKRLMVILGESSTGKTYLNRAHSYKDAIVKCKYEILDINDKTVKLIPFIENAVLFCDLDSIQYAETISALNKLDVVERNLYIVAYGRKFLERLPIPISALYRFVNVKGITKNVRIYDDEMLYLTGNTVDYYVTEVSVSGYSFMKQINTNTKFLGGASKYTQLPNTKLVIFFNSLGFGAYIKEFLGYCKKHPNIEYVLWGSFEYFLLKNVFNIDVEFDALNLEEQCTKLLNKVTNGWYPKSIGCCGTVCYTCHNNCKHYDCKSILFKAYPMLTNSISRNSAFEAYASKMNLSYEERDREYERLQKLADNSGCSIENIIKDLL